MKILALSDVVLPQMQDPEYLQRMYSDVSLLVSCGDLPASYLEYIASTLNKSLLFVRGNHDERYTDGHPGGDNLHGRIVTLYGRSFAGLEGSICYNNGPVQYTDMWMWLPVLRLMPRLLVLRSVRGYSVDVLVAHSPPRGIHDLPDRAHRGFRSFRYLMRWARPRYLIHGHVDTWDRRQSTETVFGHTTVLNINPLKLITLDD